jgi:transcriptional regulator with XRE-family HTH domain
VGRRSAPSSLRWLIGAELAHYRKQAGMTLAEASAQVGFSTPKLGHLETGRQQQAPEDIARLLKAYGALQHEIDRLTTLAGQADEAAWWAPWTHVVPDWFRTFVGLEGLAEREFVFEPILIPGLLQTADYARALTAATPRVRPDHGERFVSFRMARARRVTDRERPLHLHAVMTEGALRLDVGTPEERGEQLEHLVAMSELPNVTIQVVRPEDGVHMALTGQFALLHFANARPISWVELQDGAVYVQDPEQVEAYIMASESVRSVALDPGQSQALIKSLIGN